VGEALISWEARLPLGTQMVAPSLPSTGRDQHSTIRIPPPSL